MSASGYEIRHALLSEAAQLLMERWHAAREIERKTAKRENRAPIMIEPPTVSEIKSTAESLYEFVQQRR
jgi:hypothetical protein